LRRRQFITLLGGAAAWPVTARAQQPAMPVIGFLDAAEPTSGSPLAAIRKGLNEAGYVEGRNVAIEFSSAEGRYDRLPALAAELARRQVALIFIGGSTPAALAAKAATTTIPIVFTSGADPVALGLVNSLSRPGGNVTGVLFLSDAVLLKRLELLSELVPQGTAIAFLRNPTNPSTQQNTKNMQAAARSTGQQIIVLDASTPDEIDQAFATIVRQRVGALLVSQDVFFFSRRNQLIALATRHAVPTVYFVREIVEGGGLMSYGDDRLESFRQAGIYAGRILKGEKPADLPVLQPTKFELVINLQAAKVIGLTIPESFLLRADKVIE
jgi:putative tryptophan/tyrosine transport system substrate-binding protein